MPTSFRSSAGSSRRSPQENRQQQTQNSRRITTAYSTLPRAGSASSVNPQLGSAARHRPHTSSATTPVHAISTTAAINRRSSGFIASESNVHTHRILPNLPPDDLQVATLNALGDWTGGVLGLGGYFPAYWDEDIDDDYDEEYEESQEELEIDLEDEDEEDEEDEEDNDQDSEDQNEEFDDLDDLELDDFEDEDLLALTEEDSLFLEDDFFLGGGEEGDSLLDHGFHQHQALLDLLIGDELSSPSAYPSFIHGHPWHLGLDQEARQSPTPGSRPVQAAAPRNRNTYSPSRIATHQTNLTPESVSIADDEDEEEEADNTPNTSFSSEMPTTRRGSHHNTHTEPPTKRRRTSTTNRASAGPGNKLEPIKLDDDDPFSDPPARNLTEGAVEELPTLDLTNATEVPAELKEPYKDNRIKLAAFQCVICMDDVSALTVTHCGHLYCAECLHSSIHTGATKGRCPMCRQKLEIKPRENYTAKTKGHWLLELKVKTSTRKGKRKAGA